MYSCYTLPRRKELIPIRATKSRSMIERLPLTKARNSLGAVVKRLHLGKKYIILEKDGIPLAGLMDIDEFEDYLELQDATVREHIRKSTEEYRAGKSRPAEELSRELHAMVERRTRRRRA